MSALRWDQSKRGFTLVGDAAAAPLPPDGQLLLASALATIEVVCDSETYGFLEDVYFDAGTGKLGYAAVYSRGVRVVPWRSVSFDATLEPRRLRLECTRGEVDAAPELDGEMGATIYSPAFRERVDALFYAAARRG